MTLELQKLTIRYGDFTAVDEADVVFPSGACGLLGPNGAGKSSILKALLGLVKPTSGDLVLSGRSVSTDPIGVRSLVGYMPERDAYLPGLNGFETVRLCAQLSGVPKSEATRRAHEVLYLVGLDEQRYRPVAEHSTGMRQKVKLASALVHDPQVLLLDEPTNGLDPEGREEMLGLIRSVQRDLEKSVILCSHLLHDVEAVCSDVVVLFKGKVVDHGPTARLVEGAERVFRLEWTSDSPSPLEPLRLLDGVQSVESSSETAAELVCAAAFESRRIFDAVRDTGGAVRSLSVRRQSLEDRFMQALESAVETGRSLEEVAP
ncbi:MAG: ABC transporter ATP-binding protein [Planctomycetota bacterium]